MSPKLFTAAMEDASKLLDWNGYGTNTNSNFEFEWYSNNRTNSFTRKGSLNIRPTLLADQFGEDYLSSGTLNVEGGSPADLCTNPTNSGCERTGTKDNILNPIKSARLRTVNSFSFRYGRLEVRAKMPAGDWLWPAIWLFPAYEVYGVWPASGEIDLVESRGNRQLVSDGVNIGTQQVASTIHLGPYPALDRYGQVTTQNTKGYDSKFHRYQLEWTPEYIKFSVDDKETDRIEPGKGGFWEYAGYSDEFPNLENPYRYATKMAPYDQKFYIIINLAVGGINFFPDDSTNPAPKPWSNDSPTAATDFWKARKDWLPTWDMSEGGNSTLQVDYVRVWAL